ncbi:MAG: hypothetical protein JSW08_00030 [archaeon]|nr:MAG: hypothetical protein JSW08_00030 [archaeon]
MKKLLLPLIFVFLISLGFLVGAEVNPCGNDDSFLGTGRQNQNITLKQICDDCTYVNLTGIKYPNQELDLLNVEMTQSGVNFYYTFTNTSQLECYSYQVCGDKDGGFECETIWFKITPSGFTSTFPFFIIFIIIIVLIFIMGVRLENNWMMMFGSILILLLGFFVIRNGIDIIKDSTITWAIGLILWAIGIVSMFLSVEEALKQWR